MAHPKRREQAKSLVVELKSLGFDDVTITWDKVNSEWDTGYRAMRSGVDRADWHLVLQDDAILTPYFYDNLKNCLEAIPTRSAVSLYTGQVRPLPTRVGEAVKKASQGSWLKFYMLLWGVAIVVPTELISAMLEYVSSERFNDTLYDSRIGIFFQRTMLPIYYTVPSLVDHADHLGSLLEHDYEAEPRVAYKLATDQVKWKSAVIDI